MELINRRLRAVLARVRADPVAKNSFILFFSEGTTAVLTMGTGFLIARFLNVADFGRFTAALAYASIVAVLVDSGMGMLAAKDIAQSGSVDRSELDQLFSWRLWVILLACAAGPLLGWALLPSSAVRRIAAWLIPGVLLLGTTDFFCWIFKGAQRVMWCAGLQITSRALLLGLGVAALFSPHPIPFLLAAYALSGASMTVVGLYILAHSMRTLHWVRLPRHFFVRTLPDVYKIGAILILSVIFTRVDLMIVSRFRGDAQAGLFAAASRVVDALRLIPMVVYSVYLPLFSSFHDQPALLRSRFKVAHDFLLMLSVTIAVVGCAFAWPLFTYLLGPQYQGSVPCFRPLVWSCVLMFSNILMFSLLYALNDHRTALAGIIGALVIEVALDLILLPHFGITAASWARLGAEVFNCSMMAWGLLRRGVLRSSAFFIRPLLLVGACAALLAALKNEPMFFQFLFTWGAFITLAFLMGFGRAAPEEEAAFS